MNIEIIHLNNPDGIIDRIAGGYCAVECSIGGESLTCGLKMDHHGSNSHLEGVSIRSYRDHYGARKGDPRFVVTGKPDADATFAIAALCGLLPHPSNDIEGKPWLAGFDRDISSLAALVNLIDTQPIGVRLEEKGQDGVLLLAFNATSSGMEDAVGFYSGVDRWRYLTSRPQQAILDAALQSEKDRVESARDATVIMVGDEVAFVTGARTWGFDVWYAEHAPCVVSLAQDGNATVGCISTEKAEQMFGPGGLKTIFAKLAPEGWGGREAIGGSPRGYRMTYAEALSAAHQIASFVNAPVNS